MSISTITTTMAEKDKERLEKFYKDALDTHGTLSPQSLHWSDTKNQLLRFEILLAIADISHTKILDVGCGLGDLYKYLLTKHIPVYYTGIDVMPEFIYEAQKKYPEVVFFEKNISDITEMYDYILASGALSFKLHERNNQEYYFSLIKKMYDCATKGVAFNMLLRSHHIDDYDFATYDPEEVSDFCKTFCTNVQIVVDYLPHDFTVYLYK